MAAKRMSGSRSRSRTSEVGRRLGVLVSVCCVCHPREVGRQGAAKAGARRRATPSVLGARTITAMCLRLCIGFLGCTPRDAIPNDPSWLRARACARPGAPRGATRRCVRGSEDPVSCLHAERRRKPKQAAPDRPGVSRPRPGSRPRGRLLVCPDAGGADRGGLDPDAGLSGVGGVLPPCSATSEIRRPHSASVAGPGGRSGARVPAALGTPAAPRSCRAVKRFPAAAWRPARGAGRMAALPRRPTVGHQTLDLGI